VKKKIESGRRISRFYAGAMESAGLGEAAHFLRKAKQQIVYAKFALENMEKADALDLTGHRVSAIIESIGEALSELETTEMALVVEAEEKEEEEGGK
jgi:hypothetical protein